MNIVELRTNKKTFLLSAGFYDESVELCRWEVCQSVTMVMYKDFNQMNVEIFKKKMAALKTAGSIFFIIKHVSQSAAAVFNVPAINGYDLNSLLELRIDGSTIFTKDFTKNVDINVIKKMLVLLKKLQSKGEHQLACCKVLDIKDNYINTGIVLRDDLIWMNNMNLYISKLKI